MNAPDRLRALVAEAEAAWVDGRAGYEALVDEAGEGWHRPAPVQKLVDLAPELAELCADMADALFASGVMDAPVEAALRQRLEVLFS